MNWENLMAEKRYEEARSLLEKQIKDNPTDHKALERLGVVHFYQNEFEKAESFFVQSFEIEGSLDLLYNIIKVKYKLNKYPEVTYLANEYIKLDQTDASVLEMLGDSYFHAGEYDKAIETFESVHSLKGAVNASPKLNGAEGVPVNGKQNEKDRLEDWSNKFYEISIFGEQNRKKRELSFHFLFKDQVLEYKLVEKMKKYGFHVLNQVSVLDAGCGDGRWLRKIVDWGGTPERLIGIDVNEPILHLAKQLSAPGIHFLKAHADELSFPDGKFDMILMIGVLQHIIDPALRQKIAGELVRVLSDDGILITYNITENVEQGMSEYLSKTTKGFGPDELADLFRDCEIEFERMLLNDPLIASSVPAEWGSLYDHAKDSGLRNHHFGIAVIRKKRGSSGKE